MNIIPNAAYLSPSQTRILYGYAGFSTRDKTVLRDPGTNHILEYDDEIPTDLILLYAPGDKVVQMEDTWADLNLADFEAGSGGTKHGTVTKIYRER